MLGSRLKESGLAALTQAQAAGAGENSTQARCRNRQTADPSAAPLAMKLREAPLRMTVLMFISNFHEFYVAI
jgi:hypothetical protein